MKVFHFTRTTLSPVVLSPASPSASAFAFTNPITVAAFAPPSYQRPTRQKTTLFQHEILSDMDSMCIANAVDLCSHYGDGDGDMYVNGKEGQGQGQFQFQSQYQAECDVEEREAMILRFEDQADLLARRMAETQCLLSHLKTGDHGVLEEDEVENLKLKIMESMPLTSKLSGSEFVGSAPASLSASASASASPRHSTGTGILELLDNAEVDQLRQEIQQQQATSSTFSSDANIDDVDFDVDTSIFHQCYV